MFLETQVSISMYVFDMISDQQQGEQIIKLVSDDKQQFYRVYRIYV